MIATTQAPVPKRKSEEGRDDDDTPRMCILLLWNFDFQQLVLGILANEVNYCIIIAHKKAAYHHLHFAATRP
jgi:hypothetical protein